MFCGRAEQWSGSADIVTLRAVEQFERVLPVAARLVRPEGWLCLLIGAGQLQRAQQIIGDAWRSFEAVAVPESSVRTVALAKRIASCDTSK